MYKIKITRKANDNISNIHSYIAQDNIEIADMVIERFYSIFDYLCIFPKLWKIQKDDFREIIDSKYKYRILYKIIESKKEIIIYFIFNNSKY